MIGPTHVGCYPVLFVMLLSTSSLTTMNFAFWQNHRMQCCTVCHLVAAVLSDLNLHVDAHIGHGNCGVYPPDIGPWSGCHSTVGTLCDY